MYCSMFSVCLMLIVFHLFACVLLTVRWSMGGAEDDVGRPTCVDVQTEIIPEACQSPRTFYWVRAETNFNHTHRSSSELFFATRNPYSFPGRNCCSMQGLSVCGDVDWRQHGSTAPMIDFIFGVCMPEACREPSKLVLWPYLASVVVHAAHCLYAAETIDFLGPSAWSVQLLPHREHSLMGFVTSNRMLLLWASSLILIAFCCTAHMAWDALVGERVAGDSVLCGGAKHQAHAHSGDATDMDALHHSRALNGGAKYQTHVYSGDATEMDALHPSRALKGGAKYQIHAHSSDCTDMNALQTSCAHRDAQLDFMYVAATLLLLYVHDSQRLWYMSVASKSGFRRVAWLLIACTNELFAAVSLWGLHVRYQDRHNAKLSVAVRLVWQRAVRQLPLLIARSGADYGTAYLLYGLPETWRHWAVAHSWFYEHWRSRGLDLILSPFRCRAWLRQTWGLGVLLPRSHENWSTTWTEYIKAELHDGVGTGGLICNNTPMIPTEFCAFALIAVAAVHPAMLVPLGSWAVWCLLENYSSDHTSYAYHWVPRRVIVNLSAFLIHLLFAYRPPPRWRLLLFSWGVVAVLVVEPSLTITLMPESQLAPLTINLGSPWHGGFWMQLAVAASWALCLQSAREGRGCSRSPPWLQTLLRALSRLHFGVVVFHSCAGSATTSIYRFVVQYSEGVGSMTLFAAHVAACYSAALVAWFTVQQPSLQLVQFMQRLALATGRAFVRNARNSLRL
mmetsp:Transcript_109306/g.308449  ORF Transcript_109306/g.308449 Transcript_109306/m.308449 type:complete len:733 (-) Transcript_109306:120-2318(-)